MGYHRRYKYLLEMDEKEVPMPEYANLAYAVCACHKEACGWQGWILTSVIIGEVGHKDGWQVLVANDDRKCPRCGHDLFTIVEKRFDLSPNQRSPSGEPGVDYEVLPIEYVDDE